MVTAGHCINNYPFTLANTRFVFGYRLLASGQVQNRIPNSAIYRGVQVLADREAAADFAVVRLDRNVSPQVPLPIQRSGAVAVNTPLYVIGYPSGLPAKVATGAHVIASNADFFRANLDTYGGNSGSPVFNATNDKVVGVLVRGAGDYVSARQLLRLEHPAELYRPRGIDPDHADRAIRADGRLSGASATGLTRSHVALPAAAAARDSRRCSCRPCPRPAPASLPPRSARRPSRRPGPCRSASRRS